LLWEGELPVRMLACLMFSPVMMFFSLLPTGFESPSLTSPVALDPSLQPHAAVSLNRAAVFNASCDCIDLRAARSADGPGGGYALLATPPLSGVNASFDLSFEVLFQNPTSATGIGLLLFDANDHDKEFSGSNYGDGLGSYVYMWRGSGRCHWAKMEGGGCKDTVPEAEYTRRGAFCQRQLPVIVNPVWVTGKAARRSIPTADRRCKITTEHMRCGRAIGQNAKTCGTVGGSPCERT